MNNCEMRRCPGKGKNPGYIHVNDNCGDAAYLTSVCKTCAGILLVHEGGDLPEPAECDRLYTKAYRNRQRTAAARAARRTA